MEMDNISKRDESPNASKTLLASSKQRLMNSEAEIGQDTLKGATSRASVGGQAVTAGNDTKMTAGNETATKKRKSKPAYLQSLNESEKQANFKIIEKMNKKISFLKNPRYKKNQAPIIMTDAMKNNAVLEATSMKISSFRVEPPQLNF